MAAALEVSSASYYRPNEPKAKRIRKPSARALSEQEKEHVLQILTDDKYVDMTVAEVFYALLDQGTHYCSKSTMYGILRANKAVKERRDFAQAAEICQARFESDRAQPGVELGHYQAGRAE